MPEKTAPTPATPAPPVSGDPVGSGGATPSITAIAEYVPSDDALLQTLLDGAQPQPENLEKVYERQKAVAADASRPVEERLEAFDDIVDSDIGDTNMARARNIERETGLRQIWLKYEGGNPTGTQKDRIAFAQVRDALRRNYEAITVATCGNYGAAISLAAALAGLRCLIYLPQAYHSRRIGEMRSHGAELIRLPGDYETAVAASRERAGREELYDANPGGANTALQIEAYAQIVYEIFDELRDAPAAMAVPVSNGTTLAGIYKGWLSLFRRGKTSKMPRLIAGSSYGKNPIIQAFRKNRTACADLDPKVIHETPINEPLINWHSSEGDQALNAVRRTGGWAEYASDRDMLHHARLVREREGMNVLPASTAGIAVMLSRHRKEPLPGDRYVALLTGRRNA